MNETERELERLFPDGDEKSSREEETLKRISKEINRNTAAILDKIRTLSGVQIQDIAEALDKSPNHVGKLFSQGTFSFEDICQICYYLDVPVFMVVMMAEEEVVMDYWPNQYPLYHTYREMRGWYMNKAHVGSFGEQAYEIKEEVY